MDAGGRRGEVFPFGAFMLGSLMMEKPAPKSALMPSATPSDAEIAAWHALPLAAQEMRLRASFADPACSRVSGETMASLLDKARAARVDG